MKASAAAPGAGKNIRQQLDRVRTAQGLPFTLTSPPPDFIVYARQSR